MLRSIAETGLREYFLFMPFMGANTILSVYFTSKEMPKQAQLISLLRGTILIIPLAFIAYMLRSMTGVWLTVPIAELITTLVGMSILLISLQKNMDRVTDSLYQQDKKQYLNHKCLYRNLMIIIERALSEKGFSRRYPFKTVIFIFSIKEPICSPLKTGPSV